MTSRRQIALLFGGLLFAAGCKGTGASAATSLSYLSSTGSVAGQHGKLRIVFTSPVSRDTDVVLASSTPSIVGVSDHVTVPSGSLVADVDFDALVVGSSIITASAGGINRFATSTVVDALTLQPSSGSVALEPGASATASFSLNINTPEPVDLTITPEDPSIASSTGTVTVPVFSSNEPFLVTGKAAGHTALIATLGDQKSRYNVNVVDHARLTYVYAPAIVELGGTLSVQLGTDAIVAAASPITIVSSDPTVAAAPTGIVMPAGSSYATFTIPLLGKGSTRFTFTLADSTVSATLLVLESAQLDSINLSFNLQVGMPSQLSVRLDSVAAAAHDVKLTSSDPTVLAVPDHLTVQIGSSSAFAYLTPLKQGSAVVTATLGDFSLQVLATVGYQANTVSVSAAGQLTVGAVSELSVSTGSSSAGAKLVLLTSSDPTVVSVPSTLVVQGSNSALMTALKGGSATITATVDGVSDSATVKVLDKAELQNFGPSYSLAVGQSTTAYVYFNAVVPLSTTLTFTSSDPSIVPAPTAVNISSSGNYAYVIVKGMSAGTSVLTVTTGTTSLAAVVYVGETTPSFTSLGSVGVNANSLVVGATASGNANVNGSPVAVSTPATLTFSTPGILALVGPDPVFIAGSTNASFVLRALAVGTTDVKIAFAGTTQAATVSVVATPTVTLNVPANVTSGTTLTGSLQLGTLLANNLVYTLTSMNPGVATVSIGSITLRPGDQGATVAFGVKGIAAGMTTINAVAGTSMLSGMVTVAP